MAKPLNEAHPAEKLRGRHIRPRHRARHALIVAIMGLALALGVGAVMFLEDHTPQNQAHTKPDKPHSVDKSTVDATAAPLGATSAHNNIREGSPDPQPSPTDTPPDPSPTPNPESPKPGPGSWEQKAANDVLNRVNTARSEAGCGPVRAAPALAQAATEHSADMATNNYFSHTSQDGRTPWDRAQAAGYHHASGENIAMGHTDAASVMKMWMQSQGHRDNILNCASNTMGLGVVKSGDGTPYWTQMFGAE